MDRNSVRDLVVVGYLPAVVSLGTTTVSSKRLRVQLLGRPELGSRQSQQQHVMDGNINSFRLRVFRQYCSSNKYWLLSLTTRLYSLCFTSLLTSIHFILKFISNVKVTRSSINFRFTPDECLWFRPKYRITSNITLFIQPLPLLQLLSGLNRKNSLLILKNTIL